MLVFGEGFGYQPRVGFTNSLHVPLPTLDIVYDVNLLSSSDGTQIDSITDTSANVFSLLASGTARPYWTNEASILNNRAFLVFDAVDDFAQTNFTTTFAQSNSFWFVAKRSTSGTGLWWMDSGSAGTDREILIIGGGGTLDLNAGSSTVTGPVIPQNVWMLIEVVVNGNSSFINTNGVGATTNMTGIGTQGLKGLAINGRYSNTGWAGMHLAYFALKNGAISDAERTAMRNTLNSRFSLY